ncbi:aliphatic sulfonate ABC transporter substrate-binding protein [Nocardioides sp. MAH-18]|uniref:Putative aliphatic sulfonates-binding protein n=1 Tax=Nocardioides agri TaxID=2682843 RepID=A0A6L6XMQ6_9ACTN|nr:MULTISPECIES: ABC transporter substrate-binding protein [unclassified Nocardioides]MBA2952986.1 ABC transporter substrate-binding protein [Nocardioides sp. CGMCC 1.13656]MVQ47856.1 aliphatic sulfonate ABC transporter substrate-binding protein [Nocardioides sp. MAH-18]
MIRKHSPTRRTKLAALGAALATVLALAGCGGSATGNEGAVDDDGNVDLSKVTLIVGDQKGGSKALLAAAGLLDDVEYDVQWKEFTSGPPLLEALNSGAIHVGGVGNTPPLFAAAGQAEFQAIQAATYGGTGDAIVVPPGSSIKSVADLKGKTVGVAEGSSANYHLLAQLEKAGLTFSDITVKDLQPGDALTAFDAGHLDAWAIWEPFTSQAEIQAGAKVIADGTDVVNGLVFQAASNEALEDPATTAALQDYVGRIAQAQVWSQTHQEEWAKTWAEETGLPEEVTLAAVQKRRIELVPIDQSVIDSEQEMADTFVDNGLLPEKYDVAPYFSDAYNEYTTGEK